MTQRQANRVGPLLLLQYCVLLVGFGFCRADILLSNLWEIPFQGEKPEGETTVYSEKLNCKFATYELLQIAPIDNALFAMEAQVYERTQNNPDFCQLVSGTANDLAGKVCHLDYALLGQARQDFQEACLMYDGAYVENEHRVDCDNSFTGERRTYHYTNHPMCFSKTECLAANMERWMEDAVDDLEFEQERGTAWICDSDLVVTKQPITTTTGANNDDLTCPRQSKANATTCGPLSDSIDGQDCDCYSFCGRELIGCELFQTVEDFDTICVGVDEETGRARELVLGCTVQDFVDYDLAQKIKTINAQASNTNQVDPLKINRLLMALVLGVLIC